jgi:hypothetical protein
LSAVKRLAATAAAAAAIVTGTVAFAGPAMAAPGYADYVCGASLGMRAELDRNTGNQVVLTTELDQTLQFGVPVTVTATLDAVGALSTTLAPGNYDGWAVTSQAGFPTVTAAPSLITFTLTDGSNAVVLSCNRTADNGGWPV